MRPTLPTSRLIVLAALAAAAVGAVDADAQVRRGRQQPVLPPWAPISVGVRFGWEQERLESGGDIGAEIRIPVVRDGRFELVPSFDAIFLNPEREHQFDLEVFSGPGGPRGGVFVGGGVAWRQSVLAGIVDGLSRDRYFGYNLTLGGKQPIGRVLINLTIRWTLLEDTEFDPNAALIGISLPLWGGPIRPGG